MLQRRMKSSSDFVVIKRRAEGDWPAVSGLVPASLYKHSLLLVARQGVLQALRVSDTSRSGSA